MDSRFSAPVATPQAPFTTDTVTIPFHNLEEAEAKVKQWKRVAQQSTFTALSSAVDLTVNPSAKAATFPGLTPFYILHEKDILSTLVSTPSTIVTTLGSVTYGAFIALVILSSRFYFIRRALPQADQAVEAATKSVPHYFARLRRWLGVIIRVVLTTVITVVYYRFLRRRRPSPKRVSYYSNCSNSVDGPCIVADSVLMMTNSHAGTHADTPQHFSRLITVKDFDPAHYTGDAVILDVREALLLFSLNGRALTRSVMIEAVTHNLPSCYRDGTRPLWRLLVVTKARPPASLFTAAANALLPSHTDTWDEQSAYFEPEAIEYLAETFPHLLLVGIDAPSVDDPDFAPIVEGSHGAMLQYGMAILENLTFSQLESRLPGSEKAGESDATRPGYIEGGLLTVFNPVLSFEDSKGCCVMFLPVAEDRAEQPSA